MYLKFVWPGSGKQWQDLGMMHQKESELLKAGSEYKDVWGSPVSETKKKPKDNKRGPEQSTKRKRCCDGARERRPEPLRGTRRGSSSRIPKFCARTGTADQRITKKRQTREQASHGGVETRFRGAKSGSISFLSCGLRLGNTR